MAGDALAYLHQSLLDVARLLCVVQVFSELLVRKFPAKPGVPPEQKGH
jgi:hypothetical protein